MTAVPSRGATGSRASALGAWTLVLTGVGHVVTVVISSSGATSPSGQVAQRAMARTQVAIAGSSRSLQQLFTGFSVTMALLLCGFGAINLYVLRCAPQLFTRRRGLLALDLAVTGGGLVLALLLLPPPPVVLFTVAAGAFAVALTKATRFEGSEPSLVGADG